MRMSGHPPKSAARGQSRTGLSALRFVAQCGDQRRQGGRRLPPTWMIKIVAREHLAPLLQDPREPPGRPRERAASENGCGRPCRVATTVAVSLGLVVTSIAIVFRVTDLKVPTTLMRQIETECGDLLVPPQAMRI